MTDEADKHDMVLAHSGRVEFFKHTLTLSLAGLAGFAVLFINNDNVPSGTIAFLAVSLAGISMVIATTSAMMGLSLYGNLIYRHGIKTYAGEFEKSMVNHARACFVALLGAAAGVIGYGATSLYAGPGAGKSDGANNQTIITVAHSANEVPDTSLCDRQENVCEACPHNGEDEPEPDPPETDHEPCS
ncbi:MAG: hypothetical protein AAF697_11605 [Pseudomonadota bacterium]